MKHSTKASRKASMSSKNKAEKAASTPDTKAPLLRVKSGMNYRGARGAWYSALQEHDGKTEADFIKATTEKCPQLTKAGVAENPSGWLRFFKGAGAYTLQG